MLSIFTLVWSIFICNLQTITLICQQLKQRMEERLESRTAIVRLRGQVPLRLAIGAFHRRLPFFGPSQIYFEFFQNSLIKTQSQSKEMQVF